MSDAHRMQTKVAFTSNLLALVAIGAPLAAFLIVYVPVAGQGFISDDFRWVRESQIAGLHDVVRLFEQQNGFYRPLVALSFGVNRLLGGTQPRPFGLTNLALALACAGLVAVLCRRLTLSTGAACFAAGLWLLNFHGINMAILWISGRTALLLTAATLLAAVALVDRKYSWSVVFVGFALFTKEEAVVVPFILATWALVLRHHATPEGRRRLLMLTAAMAVELATYFWLRGRTGAMTPSTAPPYYQLTFAGPVVLRNLLEYADRSLSYSTGAALLGILLLRRRGTRVRARFTVILLAAAWYVGGYAITTFVPTRSSLYACLPAIAGALLAAELCDPLWRQASEPRRRAALVVAAIIPLVTIPVYVARNERWTELSRFSTEVRDTLTPHVRSLPEDTWLVLVDDTTDRVNLQAAFGSLLPDAIAVWTGRTPRLFVERGSSQPADPMGPCEQCPRRRFVVSNRRLHELRDQRQNVTRSPAG